MDKNKPRGKTNKPKGRPFFSQVKDVAKDLALTAGKTGASELARWGIKSLIAAVNHPTWYTKYPLTGIVNANFGVRRGKPDTFFTPTDTNTVAELASVACFRTELMYTGSQDDNTPQAMQLFYAKLRAANFGAVNYSVHELANYLYTVREIHALHAYVSKLVSALNTVNPYDASIPATMTTIESITYSDLLANAANIRSQLNLLGRQIQASCPGNITLINRTRWLFSNYFSDGNDVKAALYQFYPVEVHVFKEDGTIAKTYPLTTVAQIIDAVTNIMTYFANIETFSVIAGDMMRAFGEATIFQNTELSENSVAGVTYDEYVLNQINNICMAPQFSGTSTTMSTVAGYPVKTVESQVIKSVYYTLGSSDAISTDVEHASLYPYNVTNNYVYVNSAFNSVDPGRLLSLTRFSNLFIDVGNGSVQYAVYGTEVVTGCTVVFRDENLAIAHSDFGSYLGVHGTIETNSWTLTDMGSRALEFVSQLDWFPLIAYMTPGSIKFNFAANPPFHIGHGRMSTDIIWDFRNYAKVQDVDLAAYHNFALLSLLAPDQLEDVAKYKAIGNKALETKATSVAK